jgi:hypothetical protein
MASTGLARSQVDRRELEAQLAHLTAVERDAKERLRPLIAQWRDSPGDSELVEDCAWLQRAYEDAATERERCAKQLAELKEQYNSGKHS